MLAMGGAGSPADALTGLNIVPFAVSYEYESCDSLKARELYIKRRGTYEKVPGEDLRSIVTGVKQPKGAIHIQICPPLRPDEIEGLAAGESGNDMIRGVAHRPQNICGLPALPDQLYGIRHAQRCQCV